jgi:alpha-mannosidase
MGFPAGSRPMGALAALASIGIAALFFALPAAAQPPARERVYLAPDDHTDYVWTADEDGYRDAILQMTDYYLDLADKTAGEPSDFQSRWNLDGSLWMWVWEKNRDQRQIDRLVDRLRDGHFSMPLNFAVSTYGGMPTEAVLRGMYYSGSVERRYGLHLPMAIAMEDQTLPRGLGSLWAGSGARYSWRGVCACATKMKPTIDEERPSEIYWWQGPDGSRILMKWYSDVDAEQKKGVYQPGTYLEANNPALDQDIPLLNSAAFRKRYPYKIVGLFGEGGDNLSTMNDQFVRAAKQLSRPDREVIVSNEEDFFRDFEKTYGADIPTYSTGLGNEWDLYSASMQEVSSSVRRATEKLRSAEAMETLVSLKHPDFPQQFSAARDQAWASFGLFWEHDWTADNPKLARSIRADWQRRVAKDITSYVDRLYGVSAGELGSSIRREGKEPRYFVFNSLSWERTDFADLPYTGEEKIHVVDLATGETVPSQFVDLANDDGSSQRALRIQAADVPPVGYKVFAVMPGAGQAFPKALSGSGGTVENADYQIKLNDRGAIASLVAKKEGDRELASSIDGRAVNDLGPGFARLSIKNEGPVSITLQAQVSGPLPHTTEVTLFRGSDRIAIRNEITANFSEVHTWAFSFNLRSPDVWHEEIGAINHARIAPEGDYAARFSRLDWLTLNHFVAMSGADGVGVTVSNWDDSFMKLGRSEIANGVSKLDSSTPQISVLAGGQVDGRYLGIPDQGGDKHFLQRFALRGQRHFDAADSMRFALEDQNPLVAGAVVGGQIYPEKRFSLLQVSDPHVLLWALKPSEEGIGKGVTARFWNVSARPSDFTGKMQGKVLKAWKMTHIETDLSPESVDSGALRAGFQPWQLRTFLLQPAQ